MYGRPFNFDQSVLIGRTLELVSFTENTIHFQFDGEISITLTSSYSHDGSAKQVDSRTRVPAKQSSLMSLTGEVVKASCMEDSGTLTIEFGNGDIVKLFDDTPQYEAYRIAVGEKEFFV